MKSPKKVVLSIALIMSFLSVVVFSCMKNSLQNKCIIKVDEKGTIHFSVSYLNNDTSRSDLVAILEIYIKDSVPLLLANFKKDVRQIVYYPSGGARLDLYGFKLTTNKNKNEIDFSIPKNFEGFYNLDNFSGTKFKVKVAIQEMKKEQANVFFKITNENVSF